MEAVRRIRADTTLAAIPIIALTASVLKEDREKCFAAGMDDFISKPIDSKQLYERLERWIGSKPKLQIVDA